MDGNIIIIEDELSVLKLLKEILTSEGYYTRAFNNSELALRSMKLESPDLVLLDVRMPLISGIQLCKQIKSNLCLQNIPVIFISGLTEVADKVKAFQVGCSDYITKPFQKEEVLSRVKSHLSLYRNFQEIKQINQALQKSETRVNMAQTIASLGYWEWDRETGQVELSHGMQMIFGLQDALTQICYDDFLKFVHEEDRELFASHLQNIELDGTFKWEYRIVSSDNCLRILQTKARSLFSRDMPPCSPCSQKILGVSQDITERKYYEDEIKRLSSSELYKAKMEAERANNAKTEFLSSMSHELRTPLNAVLGFAQLLEQDDLTEDQLDSVQEILISGGHLLDLINQILDLSKIEAGKLDVKLEVIDLNQVIEECLAMEQPIASEFNIKLINELCEEHKVIADKLYLKQILLNLISNGIKYNDVNGTVTVKTQHIEAQTLKIEVIDTGRGLSEDQVNKLFQSFERLNAKYSSIQGSGIGLVISKKLIEKMQGRIGVESIENQGSCFWIELPIQM